MPAAEAHALATAQFLEWLDRGQRSHAEVMDAWRSSCPRLSIWEDAVADGLVRLVPGGRVELTEAGSRFRALVGAG